MAEQQRKDNAEKAADPFTSGIITNPYTVDPRAIANDPNLTPEWKERLANFREEAIRRNQGQAERFDTSGNYFKVSDRVFANDATQITNPDDIYALADPNKTPPGELLTLPQAKELAGLVKDRASRNAKGDYQADLIHSFQSALHNEIAEPFGPAMKIPGGDMASFQYKNIIDQRIKEGLDRKVPISKLLDSTSPDYVAKDLDQVKKSAGQSMTSGSTLFGGGNNPPGAGIKPMDRTSLDRIKTGPEGLEEGRNKLRALATANPALIPALQAYAINRGWAQAGSRPPAEFKRPEVTQ